MQIYIIDSYDRAVDDKGYLYCVSTSDESYMELIDERDRLEDGGKICVLRGSYNNGGAVAMDMEEFMHAMGERDLVTQIRRCFDTDAPLPSALHDAAMQLYRQYLVVGGMPECVMQFAQTKDYTLIRYTQDTILASYLNDMSKYNNLNEIKKTRLAYDNDTV